MKILFAGTPEFVVPVLEALHASAHEVAGVITQPDRRGGRGHHVIASPVKRAALAAGLPVFQPENVNAPESLRALHATGAEAMMIAAYGRLLSREVLALPPRGCFNVHLSLLPKYRGAAPVARAIERGEAETGVTLMRVTRKMDAGPALIQVATPIGPNETAGELRVRLGVLGAQPAVETLDRVEAGAAEFVEQDASRVTFAPALDKEDGHIDWARPAAEIERLVRAMNPWPMAFTFCGTLRDGRPKRLILTAAQRREGEGAPGEVIALEKAGPVVAAGSGALLLKRVRPAGSREMAGDAFARGHHLSVGDVLNPSGGPNARSTR